MLLAQSALIPPVLLLTCGDATVGGASVAGGGGVSVVDGGGASVAGGGVSVVDGGGASVAGGGVSVVDGGGACAVSPSPAGGASVGQLPLASGVEPSGHNCAYEGCSIDDDCTVRIAAVTRIILIIIDTFLYIVLSNANAFFIRNPTYFSPFLAESYRYRGYDCVSNVILSFLIILSQFPFLF
jgi:hypothetical protein